MFQLFKKKDAHPDHVLVAPCDGKRFPIEDVKDDVFSQKMMGEGIAIALPMKKITVNAVANGTLSAVFPTGHAFGITLKNGVEVLLHIGINTVEANGDGFTVLKKQDEKVNAGDPVIEVDVPHLAEKYDTSLMIVVTETGGHQISFNEDAPAELSAGEVIATVSA